MRAPLEIARKRFAWTQMARHTCCSRSSCETKRPFPRRAGMRASVALIVSFLAVACSSSSGIAGLQKCRSDADCKSGEVCDEDDPNDSYCTPTCTSDSQCPPQLDCPDLSPTPPKCYQEQQLETASRGVCDQFHGLRGPNSCKTATPSSSDPKKECSYDSQCSSKCSDCPRCSSGSCTCGHRGVSKACLY